MENGGGALLQKEWFIQAKDGKVEDYYSFDEKKTSMGKGQYGVVVKAIQKSNNQIRAIKIIKKKKVKDPDRLRTEVTILKKIDHPNVVRLYEIFETPEKLYLVMEMCEGGQVFDRYLEGNRKADEGTAKRIFRDVVNAIVYCHNHKICHRDLKPENLLLLSKKQPSTVKVIDFGLSAIFDQKQRMKTKAGTCYFISPEVLQGKYDESCDVWSLGVILYFLVSGVPPFYGESELEILEMVKRKEYTFNIPEFEGVCESAKDLIRRCLQPSNKRITAEAILHHPWLEFVENPKSKLTMTLVDRFRNANKFKVIVLTYLATQLNHSELQYYQKMFQQNDTNHDGYLDYQELIKILVKTGVSNAQQALKITELIDTDRNGKINYNEFLTATIRPEIYSQPAKVKAAFGFFDKSTKGYINYEDVQRVVKNEQSLTKKEWMNVVGELDKEASGLLNFVAFEKLMSKN